MAVIHFYKGFGLEAEKAHMEDAHKLADLCHKNGLRVGVYVASTIAFETFWPRTRSRRMVRAGLSRPARSVQQSDLSQTRLLHASQLPGIYEAGQLDPRHPLPTLWPAPKLLTHSREHRPRVPPCAHDVDSMTLR